MESFNAGKGAALNPQNSHLYPLVYWKKVMDQGDKRIIKCLLQNLNKSLHHSQ